MQSMILSLPASSVKLQALQDMMQAVVSVATFRKVLLQGVGVLISEEGCRSTTAQALGLYRCKCHSAPLVSLTCDDSSDGLRGN